MPQGDDFIMDIPVTPAPAPVDDTPAAPAPVVSDDAASAPADSSTRRPRDARELVDPADLSPTGELPAKTPDETPDAVAQRRRDAAFAAQRRENQALKARLDALEARTVLRTAIDPATGQVVSRPQDPPPSPAAPVTGATPPSPEAFATHAQYVQAVAQWTVEQHEAVKEATTTATQIQTAWAQQEAQAHTKFPDYDEAIAADTTRYHPAVLNALQTSEQGAEVAYHLATHPEDAQRIAALAPVAALRALGRLEAQLSAPVAAAASSTPTPPPTPLPTPLTPVGGAGPGGSTVSPDQMPYDEYVSWYKKTFGTR